MTRPRVLGPHLGPCLNANFFNLPRPTTLGNAAVAVAGSDLNFTDFCAEYVAGMLTQGGPPSPLDLAMV